MRISIKVRIILGFFAVALLNGIIIMFIFYFSSMQKKLINIIPELSQIDVLNMKITSKLYEAVAKMSYEDISEAEKLSLNMGENLKKISDAGFKKEAENFQKHTKEFIGLFGKVLEGDETAMAKLADSKKELDSSYTNMRNSIVSATIRYSNIIIFLIISAIPFTIIIGITSSTLISRGVLRGIWNVSDVLGEIAKGGTNLKIRINFKTGDEIDILTNNFNSFMDSLSAIIRKLLMGNRSLEEISNRAKETYSSIKSEGRKVQQNIEEVQSSTEVVWDQIEKISYKSTVILSSQKDASEKITHEITQIRKNIDMFQKIGEKFYELFRRAEKLEEVKKEISGYVSLISDISDVINILSLNASIEAGRVGEKGKGFSVVADEIRKLSSRTKTLSANIAKSVETLINIISIVAEMMKFIDMEIKKALEENKKSILSLQSIEELSRKSVDMVTEISNSVEEIRSMAKEVSRRMVESVQSIQTIVQQVEEFDEIISSILAVSSELGKIVSNFKI